MSTAPRSDLPILDELREEFLALATEIAATEDPTPRARPAAPRARRGDHAEQPPRFASSSRRSGRSRRIARRTATVLALLCLVGGVAVAARFGQNDAPPAHTDPARLAHSASQGWQIFAYRDKDRECVLLVADGDPASACGPSLANDGLLVSSVVGERGRLAFGLTGPAVVSVLVHSGSHRIETRTSPGGTNAAAAAGVPDGTRWFVASLGDGERFRPVRVSGLDRAGERTGRSVLDCSLGPIGPACARTIEDRAQRTLR
ncbi:MAG TPA: hypothetical protein VG898_03210 [Solirubrobacterales bacterium]|nr:hypothetical protein [Solirubrobacterales bacterium]